MNILLFLSFFLISGCSTSGEFVSTSGHFLSSNEEGWFNYRFQGGEQLLVYCTSKFDKKIKPSCFTANVYEILENKK